MEILRLAGVWRPRSSLLALPHLESKIVLVTHLFDEVKLGLEEIDVILLVIQEPSEQVAGAIVSLFRRQLHCFVVRSHGGYLQREVVR
jgi:hypothetical protein